MKTVKQGKEVKRVSDSDAKIMINKGGWAYCPKSEWKSTVRDAGKASKKEAPITRKDRSAAQVNGSEGESGDYRTKRDEKRAGKEKSDKRQSKYRQKKKTAE